jgi:mannobiose 2-epimerase
MKPNVDVRGLRDEIGAALNRHVVECWFPRALGENGEGFLQDFATDWTRGTTTRRSLVYQARMTWVSATLARRAPELVTEVDLAAAAASGLRRFHARFQRPGGGLAFWDDDADRTHAYAIAFAIFAAAAVHRLAGDERSRALALEWFEWLDARGWDERAGLYRENLALGGAGWERNRVGADLMGTPRDAVSSNALIHLIEAWTEVVLATGAPTPRDRLVRLLAKVEEWVERDDGRLWATYSLAGRPLSRTVSWGHDLEAFHIVHRAREVLGMTATTPLIRLADRALTEGLDRRHGGVFLERRAGLGLRRRVTAKVWWVQAESLNALALLHRLHGKETDRFLLALQAVWQFVRRDQIDQRHRGWIDRVSRRGERTLAPAKAHAWKACYHEARALLDARDDLAALLPPPSGP